MVVDETPKQEFNMPPIYKVVEYALSSTKRIQQWTYVSWPGFTSKKRNPHKDLARVMFFGSVSITRGNEKMPVEFPIPAVTIHQATSMFDELLQEVIDGMNQPKIVLPGG